MSSYADRGAPEPRPAVRPLSVVVLISGRGSNLKAIIDAVAQGEVPAVIRAAISDRPGAAGLAHAARAGIPTDVVDRARLAGREAFETALAEAIDRRRPDLVVLAGFMRILSPDFVRRYEGRMINIHPSLLPGFPGLDTHRRALAAGVREHGASVHFVTAAVDGGPVIVRARVPVRPGDDPERLAQRVLCIEHRLYPLAIRWIAEGRVAQRDGRATFDGQALAGPLDYADFAPDEDGAAP